MSRSNMWFPIALLALSAAGAVALCRPECVERDVRDAQFFLERHIWERSFDAISAACGAGLLSGDLAKIYTPTGRWTLFAIGLAGALLYVAAAADATRRLIALDAASPELPSAGVPVVIIGAPAMQRPATPVSPPVWMLLALFLGVQAILTLGVWAAGRAVCPDVGVDQTAWLTGMAFFSLGCIPQPLDFGTAQMLAAVGWIGALGWPIWLFLIPPLRRRFVARGAAFKLAAGYTLFLVAAAGVICLLESPRGGIDIAYRTSDPTAPDPALSKQATETRFGRSLVAVACASSAGIPTEPLADRGLRDGSKAVLALVLLVGGLGGSATGGLKWPLLLWALAGGASARVRRAASGCVLWTIMLTTVTTVGLLLLESQVATKYQTPPTLADALLDATSAVAGGNLSSGLTATVTDRNLVSGIFQGINWYRLGMLWIVTAMVLGRILPIVVLGRAGQSAEGGIGRGVWV